MPDKGIQIVIALLEKRESYLITKDSNPGLVKEILRAERLGYVRKEQKSAKYTLSQKGCHWVYSGFAEDEITPVKPLKEEIPLSTDTVREKVMVEKTPVTKIAPPGPAPVKKKPTRPQVHVSAVFSKSDLRPAYASSFLITSLFLLTVWIIRVLGLV